MATHKIALGTLALFTLSPGLLLANAGGDSVSGVGVLFDGAIFLIILVCFVFAMRIFSYLRGGEMASGWQLLAVAFIILCLGQLVALISTLQIFNLNQALVVGVRFLGVLMLLLGVSRIKKVLS